MPVSESYKNYVLDQLKAVGPVIAQAMFGGVGLYRQGLFFALIADDTLYLKVDDSNRADFEQAGSKPFRPYGDDSYSMGYYEIPAEVLENATTLRDWVHKAVAVARTSTTAKGKRPRTS